MTKKKLIISLCAFVLVVAVGVVGVLAATSQTAVVKSRVGYTAKNINAKVDFVLTHVGGSPEQVDTKTWNIATATEANTEKTLDAVQNVTFSEIKDDTITYKLTVTNTAAEGGLALTATPVAQVKASGDEDFTAISSTASTFGAKNNISVVLDVDAMQSVAAQGTTTFTLTLTLTNPAFDIPTLTVNFYVDLVAVPSAA